MKKRILSIVLIVAMMISMAAINPLTVTAEPIGSLVTNAADFAAMSPGGYYYLTSNITISSTYGTQFTGTFNGNGYKITTSVPLFSSVSGTIKNLTIEGSISATSGDLGAVAKLAKAGATFINIDNKASVTGVAHAGGIVAVAECSNLTIDKCVNNGVIIGGSADNHGVGGILGYSKSTSTGMIITNCLNLKTVSTSDGDNIAVGGIVGRSNGTNSIIKNCINKGNISGKRNIGGIIAVSGQSLTIEYCLNDGEVFGVGTTGYCGGIVSRIGTDTLVEDVYTIKNCINIGDITSVKDEAGGIIAYSRRPAVFENCYNYGDVTAPARSAGIAAYIRDYYADFYRCYNYGDITNTTNTTSSTAAGIVAYGGGDASFTHQYTFESCGNEGNIQAYHYVGGIVAYLYGNSQKTVNIQFCYNTGNLTSLNSYVAGLLGYMNGVENPLCKFNYISGTLTAAAGRHTYATLYNNDSDAMEPTNLRYNYIEVGTAEYYRYKNDLGHVAFPSDYEWYFEAADLVSGELATDLNYEARYVAFYQTLGTDTFPVSNNAHHRVRANGTTHYNDLKATFIKTNNIKYNNVTYEGVNEICYIHREANFSITVPQIEGISSYSVVGSPGQTVEPNDSILMVTDKVFVGIPYETVKVMSYNIRNIEGGDSFWNDPLTFEYSNRDNYVLAAIYDEDPDVLGLQEACYKKHAHADNIFFFGEEELSWFDTLEGPNGLTKSGYSAYRGVPAQGFGADKQMYNAIYYKTAKFNFVAGGTQSITATGGDPKCANWVILETKAGGQRFIFISTHFQAHWSDADIADRIENAQNLVTFINNLKATYNYPVITVGDFNTSLSTDPCQIIVNAGFKHTRNEAKSSYNKALGTVLADDEFTTLSSSRIDHIFIKDLPQYAYVSYYETVENKFITGSVGKYPSDHLPVISYFEFPIPIS